jgi:hypothetical protein
MYQYFVPFLLLGSIPLSGFVYLTVQGYLNCFQLLMIMNQVILNIYV